MFNRSGPVNQKQEQDPVLRLPHGLPFNHQCNYQCQVIFSLLWLSKFFMIQKGIRFQFELFHGGCSSTGVSDLCPKVTCSLLKGADPSTCRLFSHCLFNQQHFTPHSCLHLTFTRVLETQTKFQFLYHAFPCSQNQPSVEYHSLPPILCREKFKAL